MSNTKIHTDMLGIPLKEGDKIAVAKSNYNGTPYMAVHTIVGFTPQRIKIDTGKLVPSEKVLLFNAQDNYNLETFPEYLI